MFDKLKHINSNNEVLEIGVNGVTLNYSNLRDFGESGASLPFILNTSKAEHDNFFDHFEVDTKNDKWGYFEVNGYTKKAKMTGSANSDYLDSDTFLYVTLDFELEGTDWIKTFQNIYLPNGESTRSGVAGQKAYPYKYPYKYGLRTGQGKLFNISDYPQDAIIRLYGLDNNPSITIGDNFYQVNVSIEQGEFVEINTSEKTVTRHKVSGLVENVFGFRNMENDIFAKVPAGESTVFWNSIKMAEIFILEERGQPRWV